MAHSVVFVNTVCAQDSAAMLNNVKPDVAALIRRS